MQCKKSYSWKKSRDFYGSEKWSCTWFLHAFFITGMLSDRANWSNVTASLPKLYPYLVIFYLASTYSMYWNLWRAKGALRLATIFILIMLRHGKTPRSSYLWRIWIVKLKIVRAITSCLRLYLLCLIIFFATNAIKLNVKLKKLHALSKHRGRNILVFIGAGLEVFLFVNFLARFLLICR